ncbi:hypothetical protein PENTCL1PPCAC_12324, partial [Pristionchus entomophagus]
SPPRSPPLPRLLHSISLRLPVHADASARHADGPDHGRSLPVSLLPPLLCVLRGQSLPVLFLLRDMGIDLLRHSCHSDRHCRSGGCHSIRTCPVKIYPVQMANSKTKLSRLEIKPAIYKR